MSAPTRGSRDADYDIPRADGITPAYAAGISDAPRVRDLGVGIIPAIAGITFPRLVKPLCLGITPRLNRREDDISDH